MRSFTLSTSWSSATVSFSETLSGAHYLTPSQLTLGLGDFVVATGIPLLSFQFQGYQWSASVRATRAQFLTLSQILGEYARRNQANDGGYMVLTDRVNRYVQAEHTLNSRSVVPGSTVTVAGITTAFLAFRVAPTEFTQSRVLRIDSDYDVQMSFLEVA